MDGQFYVPNKLLLTTCKHYCPATGAIQGNIVYTETVTCKRKQAQITIHSLRKMSNIPFQTIDLNSVERIEYKGETGVAFWQTIQFAGLRIRLVEYSN